MAVVRAVIKGTILSGSMVIAVGSMSANTGVMLFQESTWGVAGNVNGVVITSPASLRALQATMRAIVPLLNSDRCGACRYAPSACSRAACLAPLLVSQAACHMSDK